MKNKSLAAMATLAAFAAMFAAAPAANAQLLPIMLLDKMYKDDAKIASANAQHVAWCNSQKPGFRAKWNNWRTNDGRVEYCASPYHTPVWMKFLKK